MPLNLKSAGVLLASLAGAAPGLAASSRDPSLLMPEERMIVGDVAEKITITVTCGYISSIERVPELWNVTMGFDIPTQQEFEATVRLGAAAGPKLGGWNGTIRIHTWDAKCFKIDVTV